MKSQIAPQMNVTIVGLGLIGGSLALDLRATNFATHIIGVEENPDHCQQAMSRKLVDEILPLGAALEGADCVIIAIPVGAIPETLARILDLISPGTTVTDMGSTKELISRAVAQHPNRKQYVAAHPMAGTEHSGPRAALAGLFAGRTAVICDQEQSGPTHLQRVQEIFTALRMRLVWMNSSEHDLHAAYVSHLSHISSFVLANTVLAKEKNAGTIFDLAGGGFESTVRLAKSSPAMWLPIFEHNRNNVMLALRSYIENLEIFEATLKTSDFDKTKNLMNDANQIGRVLETVSRRQQTPSGGEHDER